MKFGSYPSYTGNIKRKRLQRIKKSFLHAGLYIIGLFIVIMLGISAVREFGLSTAVIDQSMNPTLKSEDTVLINRFAYRVASPGHMDVVAMKIGTSQSSPTYIRRIIGVPGDTVRITDGKIYIDDKEVTTPYNDEQIEDAGSASDGITLDEGTYFVMCDDYNNSTDDSRLDSIGTVATDQIIGKVWLISSPLSRFGRVK